MYGNWKNALRLTPISQEDMDNKKHRCTCYENPDVDEHGDNSWLPCMSHEPDCNITCRQCIFCEIIDINNDTTNINDNTDNMTNNINFGIIDIMIGTGFCSDEQTSKTIEILNNEPAVINFERIDNEDGSIMINIDQYDNKTIGDVLNKISRL